MAIIHIEKSNNFEQECEAASSTWCCPFSTTCGSSGRCNNITTTLRDERCPGQQACISVPYYWCCDSDQTCGGFRRCEGGSGYNTLNILKYGGIGFIVLALLVGLCGCIMRHQRQMAATNTTALPARNRRTLPPMQPISFINMGQATQVNHIGYWKTSGRLVWPS
ncbi:unnamed protein product, partial [Adineta steineri]